MSAIDYQILRSATAIECYLITKGNFPLIALHHLKVLL